LLIAIKVSLPNARSDQAVPVEIAILADHVIPSIERLVVPSEATAITMPFPQVRPFQFFEADRVRAVQVKLPKGELIAVVAALATPLKIKPTSSIF